MNRIDRLSAILIQLQTKPVVKAKEIAERFGISLRTVYRDIRALEEAGIPVGSEAGTGYFLAEGYHLPPVMFTKEEAGSFLLAEKLVEKLSDNSINEHYKSAMYKIKSVLKSSDKTYVDTLDSNIQVFYFQPGREIADFPNNFISDIQKSVAGNKMIEIEYISTSKNELTKRCIEPIGLCYYGLAWHLIGFCTLRNDYRDFRIDRIKSLFVTETMFEKRNRDTLDEYFSKLETSANVKKTVVRFHNSISHVVKYQKHYFGFIDEKEGEEYTEMSFLVDPPEYIAMWLMSFGNKIDVVKPRIIKSIIKDKLAELNDYYK